MESGRVQAGFSILGFRNSKMPQELNVLLLGVGGNVSQGILKALALSKLSCRVIGACISPLSFGLYTVDQAYLSPLANDPGFVDWLIRICRGEQVDAILSGVEPVLTVLAREAERICAETGAICVVSQLDRLMIGNDKLLTCQWLKEQGFAAPRSVPAADQQDLDELVHECGYPLIAKPRYGKGSHGLFELHDDEELRLVTKKNDYVIQEYLGDPHHEYTVGCFSDRESIVRGALVMRRELAEGTTYRAEVGHFPDIRAEAVRIAEALKPMGPCNIQMRTHCSRPVCFEINVRFSGTTPMRARFGFNDVEAALRHFVLGQPAAELPVVREGIALRYWNEAYVDPQATAELDRSARLDRPKQYPLVLEDYGLRG